MSGEVVPQVRSVGSFTVLCLNVAKVPVQLLPSMIRFDIQGQYPLTYYISKGSVGGSVLVVYVTRESSQIRPNTLAVKAFCVSCFSFKCAAMLLVFRLLA